MIERVMVQYADEVAAEIAQKFADSPAEELGLWVRLAHRREAMVTKLYERSQVDQRLGKLARSGPGAVVRAALLSISAHEESHTRFLSTVRGATRATVLLNELQGAIEGRVIRAATSGSLLARALIALGTSLDGVPEFASQLERMTLRELIEFQGELETTARTGYERMLVLLRRLSGDPRIEREFGYTFAYDIARILCEECFHEEAFVAMAGWVSTTGEGFERLTAGECAAILHELAERNLSLGAAKQRFDPARPVPKGEPVASPWVSDGGLGQLFREHGLACVLVSQQRLTAELGT